MATTRTKSSSIRVSSSDVARAAGVSRTTVSFVLNGERLNSIPAETRERVLKVADDLGYRINTLARGLKSGKTTLIGVLSYERHDSYHDRILHGIYSTCNALGYTPIVAHIGGETPDREIFLRMVDYHICGLIRIVGRVQEEQMQLLCEMQDRYDIPCVLVDDRNETDRFDCVANDSREGVLQAVRHLIALGHRRIGHLCAGPDSRNSVERSAGYCQALEEAGIPIDPALIQGDTFIYHRAFAAMGALLDQRPTAVFAASDQLASAFRELARQRGLQVPGDIALVGFGDLEASAYTGLSTVDQQPEELARQAIRCLDERWAEPDRPRVSIVVPTKLIARSSSTGAPLEEQESF